MSSLLIVDDEQSICWGLTQIGRGLNCDVTTASSAEQALEIGRRHRFDVVVVDVRLPGMSGLDAIPAMRKLFDSVPIIVITAHGDLNVAIEAVRLGAFEYIVKPFEAESVRGVLQRALARRASPVVMTDQVSPVEGFIGQTPAMQNVFARLALAASSDANVMVCGESGTGKEIVSRTIHKFSQRSKGPFVVVNLAALSPSLAESELFGHVRGAFTGADQARTGLLVHADQGTLFLDEIADIPLSIQVKLLRAVEQKEVVPVGANKAIPTDFRVVGATHRDINRLVQQSHFRHDLYFRLSSFRIDLPPLRDRIDDVTLLAQYYMCQHNPDTPNALSAEVIEELRRRPWWGNVRELKNAIEHAAIVSRGSTISPEHLPPPMQHLPSESEGEPLEGQIRLLLERWTRQAIDDPAAEGRLYDRFMELVETPIFRTLLKKFGGQYSSSAKFLGLHRTTLRKKIEQYSLDVQK